MSPSTLTFYAILCSFVSVFFSFIFIFILSIKCNIKFSLNYWRKLSEFTAFEFWNRFRFICHVFSTLLLQKLCKLRHFKAGLEFPEHTVGYSAVCIVDYSIYITSIGQISRQSLASCIKYWPMRSILCEHITLFCADAHQSSEPFLFDVPSPTVYE